MKSITVSDEDYETLMALSKELQAQENHHQAFPYFWEPASERLEIDPNNDGEVAQIFDHEMCESYSPEEYAEHDHELYNKFLDFEGYEGCEYIEEYEYEWVRYLSLFCPVRAYSSNWEQKIDHNPSLFLSDVKNYIETNKHHLGRNPHTYANTVHRMPKMSALIEAIYRLNPQPKDEVNQEAKRFIFKK